MGPQRLTEGPYPEMLSTPTEVKVEDTIPGFTTQESSLGRKQKRALNTPASPWELSDTYSGLQMSAILMNTPKLSYW